MGWEKIRRGVACLWLAASLTACAACGAQSPLAPSGPAGGTLGILCPLPVDVSSTDGNPVTVTFDAPRTTNGLAPVSTSCSTQPGGALPVGATTVSCQARDSGGQTASCSFPVRVHAPPRLRYTRFLAYGDSLTEGVVSQGASTLMLDLPSSYPTALRRLLGARYATQPLTVINAGNAGELVSGEGASRFLPTLKAHNPEVLLLMEGTNDLLFLQRGIAPALAALENMMKEAETANVRVCLATIPPQRAGGLRMRDAVAALIPGFNNDVRALAAARNAVLVDVYAGMKDDMALIGLDDLHPTVRGYEAMASIYFEAVKAAFELPDPAALYAPGASGATSPSRTMRSNDATR
jgi:lysophospholipase L1-like esterase